MKKFKLTKLQIDTVKELQKKIENSQCLYLIDKSKPVFVCTDASIRGVGGLVYQRLREHKVIIQFFSEKFTEAEQRKLSSVERELAAVLRIMQKTKRFFHSNYDIILYTDMQLLVKLYAHTTVCNSPKLSRWLSVLSSMSPRFTLRWSSNQSDQVNVADFLSRCFGEEETDHVTYRCKFSQKIYDSLERRKALNCVDIPIPAQWKLNGQNVDLEELIDYAQNIAQQPEIRRKLTKPIVDNENFSKEIDTGLSKLEQETENLFPTAKTEVKPNIEIKPPKENKDNIGIINVLSEVNSKTTIMKTKSSKTKRTKLGNNGLPFFQGNILDAEDIAEDQRNCPYYGPIMKALMMKKPLRGQYKNFVMIDNLLVGKRDGNTVKICLPEKSGLCIACSIHTLGHPNGNSLARRMKVHYHVKSIHALCDMVSKSCRACKLFRIPTKNNFLVGVNPMATGIRGIMTMDHFYMPMSRGNDGSTYRYVLNFADSLSKYSCAQMTKGLTAVEVVDCLHKVIRQFGVFKQLHSDRGSQLCRHPLVQEFCRKFNIEIVLGLSNQPTAHGVIENSNKLLRTCLQLCSESFELEWAKIFDLGVLVFNTIDRTYGKDMNGKGGFISNPYKLIFGLDCDITNYKFGKSILKSKEYFKIRDKLVKRIADCNRKRLQAHLKAEKDFKSDKFQPGDFILVRLQPKDKNKIRYRRNIFRVIERFNRRVTCQGLFGNKERRVIHVNECKAFVFDERLRNIPEYFQTLFGPSTAPISNTEVPSYLEPQEKPEMIMTKNAYMNWSLGNKVALSDDRNVSSFQTFTNSTFKDFSEGSEDNTKDLHNKTNQTRSETLSKQSNSNSSESSFTSDSSDSNSSDSSNGKPGKNSKGSRDKSSGKSKPNHKSKRSNKSDESKHGKKGNRDKREDRKFQPSPNDNQEDSHEGFPDIDDVFDCSKQETNSPKRTPSPRNVFTRMAKSVSGTLRRERNRKKTKKTQRKSKETPRENTNGRPTRNRRPNPKYFNKDFVN